MAARTYHAEFLWDDQGKLVFCYAKRPEGPDLRFYYDEGKLIRYMEGQTVVQTPSGEQSEQSDKVLHHGKLLWDLFQAVDNFDLSSTF